ncbi:MAG TPA: hypothetical protein VN842_02505 [Thermoplasmata archaeon]|nr:hypothetical protein [Thermoplasmata archaeon]
MAIGSREGLANRRGRVACPHCGQTIEFARMRAHLREAHQVGSAELETTLLAARRQARRGGRVVRR